jgi:hypothetical protein
MVAILPMSPLPQSVGNRRWFFYNAMIHEHSLPILLLFRHPNLSVEILGYSVPLLRE